VQARGVEKSGGSKGASSFLKTSTTTVHHAINESEKASYVSHVNNYLRDDPFLKSYLPIDPATNAFFDLVKDGVLLWYVFGYFRPWCLLFVLKFLSSHLCHFFCSKLINVAVPGTIDERAINTKKTLNPWERNENLTLGLNSAKAIGCTVVNIGTQDIAEGRVSNYIENIYLLFLCLLDLSILIGPLPSSYFLAAISRTWVDISDYKGTTFKLFH